MVNELKRPVDLPESSNAAKLARSDDVDQRNWGLEPEHTIFLSHSGEQKNFTERLCVELKRAHHCPFFDKCPDSLRKGDDFPSAIIQAARQCHVAILVLSEDFFTRSRWPMIELHEFVKAQAPTNSELKLLPLFYKLSADEFKDAERQKRWQDVWKDWAAEDVRTNRTHKVDVDAWASALSVVGRITGLEYVEKVGEVAYVEDVVEAVRKLKVPRVKYDVSHVQSLRRLCETIFAKFHDSKDDHPHYEVQVVGLFGMGGVGKTTITKAMCNGRFGDFVGEFCHVELGVKDVGKVRRQVLQDLTGEVNLPTDLDKLKTLMKKCMQHRKVFLCLDNVWLEDIEEAKMYLQLNYKVGSKVLVTSRCFKTLQSLGLQDCHCMEMPELNKCDARELFLHHVSIVSTNIVTKLEWDVIDRCVEACHFLKPSLHDVINDSSTKQYLPLALKVWGTQLGQISGHPLEWTRSLENLSTHKFNHFNVNAHPLFSLLRQGYDSLKPRDQAIFLDLALLVTHAIKAKGYYKSRFNTMAWLQHVYECGIFSIMQSLEALKLKALLDFAMTDNILEFRIHDLYLEFVEDEVQALESSNQVCHILYIHGRIGLPSKLRKEWKCRDLKRMLINESEVKSMKKDDLIHCSHVEVLQVYGSNNLEVLDVGGMDGLRILDVVWCKKLGEKFQGVDKLKDLEWLRISLVPNLQNFPKDLSSLAALQFLELCFMEDGFPLLDFSRCSNLRELNIYHRTIPSNLGNLTLLEKAKFQYCRMESSIGLSLLTNLKVLDLSDCFFLVELPGLCNLGALEILNVQFTCISELPGVGKLQHLQKLNVLGCGQLTSLVELEYVTSLCCLGACFCDSLLQLPNMINLKKLEVVDLIASGIAMIPGGFGRLAKNRILNLEGCMELLEPLVLWLWEQELLLQEGISLGSRHIKETKDKLWSNIRMDAVYYMYQISTNYFEKLEASSHNLLEEKEGGIDYAIRLLCEYEDLSILSLVVAKYSTKIIAETCIRESSTRIVGFLYEQLDFPFDGDYFHEDHPRFHRILFILQHVVKNDLLMKSLKDANIDLFIDIFSMDEQFRSKFYKWKVDLNPILKCFYP